MTKGLDAVVPRKSAYVEALTAWSSLGGPMVRLEGGARLLPGFGAFVFGDWTPKETRAGVGARFTF